MTTRKLRTILVVSAGAAAAVAAAFLVGRAWAGGIPSTAALTYSGTLEDATGAALTGSHNIQVNFWSAATGGSTPVCQTASTPISLTAGQFSVSLPDTCTAAVKASPDVWAEVEVDGASLGRTKIGAVPYAVEAGHATNADNATSATNATNAATASAAAGTLQTTLNAKADSASVPKMTGWTQGTCVLQDSSNSATVATTTTCFYRRVGDSAEVRAEWLLASAPAASGLLRIVLPANLTVDVSRVPLRSDGARVTAIGSGWIDNVASTDLRTIVPWVYNGSVQLMTTASGGSEPWNITTLQPFSLGDLNVSFSVPVTGWTTTSP